MGEFLLKGHISYATKRKYKWLAEFGKNTCEQCASLDGQEFDEDDVPYWPHPNCRCKVEEISVVDEVESEMNEYKEILSQLNLDCNEILGDINLLKEQVQQIIREAKNEARDIYAQIERLEYEANKLLDYLERQTRETIDKYMINKIQKEIENIKTKLQEYANEFKGLNAKLKAEKLIVDAVVAAGSPIAKDAAEIWKLASSKFKRSMDYIEKNGEIINSVIDLRDKDLQYAVKNKLESQLHKTDTRGVQFHTNSSISKSVSNSLEFKHIIDKYKEQLINKQESIPKISTFLNLNINNFLALHGCDIYNIRVENGMLKATIIDTVDYNPNDWKVKLPRDLQENEAIENYYIIINIEEPISRYFKI